MHCKCCEGRRFLGPAALAVLLAVLPGCGAVHGYKLSECMDAYLALTYNGIYDEKTEEIFGLTKAECNARYEKDIQMDADFFIHNILGVDDVSQRTKDAVASMYKGIYKNIRYEVEGGNRDFVMVTVHPLEAFHMLDGTSLLQLFNESYTAICPTATPYSLLDDEMRRTIDDLYVAKAVDLVLQDLPNAGFGEPTTVEVKAEKHGRDLILDPEGPDKIDDLVLDLADNSEAG